MYIKHRLLKRQTNGNLRELQITEDLVDFASNDYLGLARSEVLVRALKHEWSKMHFGLGSTGSRLLTGHSYYLKELEKSIASFHGYEAGLLFNCGYMANLGLLSSITGERDVIFYDAHIHASTHDGIRLSKAKAYAFRHQSLEHLQRRLKQCRVHGNRFICIESIYSTDGSRAPLPEIVSLAKQYNAKLIVDEAHAVGIFGPLGRGLVAEYHLTSEVFALIATFGKALGVQGAIVLGSSELKQALVNFSTPFVYTTALPIYAVAAIKSSYALFPHLKNHRVHLKSLIQLFRNARTDAVDSPIQSILIPGNEAVKNKVKALRREGLDVRALMSPTVRKGSERIRLCLHAFNTKHELATLLARLT